MAITGLTLNPGSGGSSVPVDIYAGNSYPLSIPAYGNSGGPYNEVGISQPLPVNTCEGQKTTYSAAISALVPVASATDVFEINNSAGTKTIAITRLAIKGTAGTAAQVPVTLVKRSTLNTAGTSTTPTCVPLDSTDSAATAVVKAYTANPTTGTSVGAIRATVINLPTSGNPDAMEWTFGNRPNTKAVRLAANQSLCVNFNSTSITSGSVSIDIEWCEA